MGAPERRERGTETILSVTKQKQFFGKQARLKRMPHKIYVSESRQTGTWSESNLKRNRRFFGKRTPLLQPLLERYFVNFFHFKKLT